MKDVVKDGLNERKTVPEGTPPAMKRDEVGQLPKKPAGESASKGGKKFKIC